VAQVWAPERKFVARFEKLAVVMKRHSAWESLCIDFEAVAAVAEDIQSPGAVVAIVAAQSNQSIGVVTAAAAAAEGDIQYIEVVDYHHQSLFAEVAYLHIQ